MKIDIFEKKHSYSVHMILFLSTQIGLRYTHYNIDQINIECLSDYFTVLLIIILQVCYLLHLFLLVIITFYKYVECTANWKADQDFFGNGSDDF